MAAEQLIAELRFDYSQLTTGTGASVQVLGVLEQQVDQTMARVSDASQAAFSEFAREAKIASTEYQAFATELSQSAKALSLEAVGDRLSSVAEAGKNIFQGAINQGANFQTEILKIDTIFQGSQQQLDDYADALRVIGRELGVSASPAQSAAAAYEVLSSGFTSAADNQKVLAASLKLSQAGSSEVAETTRTLAGSLNAYGESADQAARYSDILFQTVNLGVTTVPELAGSLGQVVSVAATAGITFEELSAAIATTTANGQQTTTSIAGIRGIIAALLKPGKEAADTMARFGLVVDAATLKQDGLLGTLTKIKAAVGDNTTAFKTIIADQEAFATAASLVNDGGIKFAAALEGIGQAAGSTDAALATVNQGLEQSTKQLSTSVSELATSTSQAFIPFLTSGVNAVRKLVDAADSLPGPAKAAALGLVAVAAATAGAVAASIAYAATAPLLAGHLAALGGRLLPLMGAAWKAATVEVTAARAAQVAWSAISSGTSTAASGLTAALTSGAAKVALLSSLYLGVAGVLTQLALEYTRVTEEAFAFEVQLQKSNQGLREFEDAQGKKRRVKFVSRDDATSLSASQLADRGVTTDDLTQTILDTRKRAEETDNAKIKDLFARESDSVEQKRRELAEELKKREQNKPKENGPIETDEQRKKAYEEAYKDELQLIELSKKGHTEKIQQFKDLLVRYQADGDKRRALNEKIAQEQKALETETTKATQKARDEKISQARQEIENSTKPEAAKIKALQDLIPLYRLVGDERRAIEDKVLAYEQAISKRREALIKSERQLRKDQSEGRLRDSDLKGRELDLQEGKGANITSERIEEVKTRTRERIKQVDIELESDTQGETDTKVLGQANSKAKDEKLRIAREAQIELDQLQQATYEREGQRRQELLQSEQRLAGVQIDLIRDRVLAGQAGEEQLRSAVLARLKLQEQEIALGAELARQATQDPVRIAQIEAESQASILTARKQAREEVERTTAALEEQAKAKKKSDGDFGFTLGKVRQGVEGLLDTSAFDVTKKRRDPFEGSSLLDLRAPQDSLLRLRRDPNRLLQTPNFNPNSNQPVGVKLEASFTLRDSKGKELDFDIGDVNLDGQNSKLDKITKRSKR